MMKRIRSLENENQNTTGEVERTKQIIRKLMTCWEQNQQNQHPIEDDQNYGNKEEEEKEEPNWKKRCFKGMKCNFGLICRYFHPEWQMENFRK